MTTRQRIQAVLAAISAAGAMTASITGLAQVAAKVHMPVVEAAGYSIPIGAIGLILCLDGLTLAAAYAAHGPDRDGWTIAVLLVATTASAGAQGWAAEPVLDAAGREAVSIWLVRAVHMAPAAMALGAGWLAIRSIHRGDRRAPGRQAAPKPQRTAPSAPKQAPAVQAPVPAADVPEARPASARRLQPLDEIVTAVDEWLEKEDRSPSKASVKDAGAALDLPVRGNDKALEVAGLVRARRAKAS